MTALEHSESRAYARVAGALYLTIAVSGGFAIAYVPETITVAQDPAATLTNIAAMPGLYLAGIGADFVMMLGEVMLTVMLFFMFRTISPTLSAIAALARLSMVSIMSAMLFFSAANYALATDASFMAGFTTADRASLSELFTYFDAVGVWIWQIFFALHLVILGTLISKSDAYPRLLGYGMAIGGLGYALDSLYAFALPDVTLLGQVRMALLALVTLSEVGFALWLLVRGPRKNGSYAIPVLA
jgi:hypothetical protein